MYAAAVRQFSREAAPTDDLPGDRPAGGLPQSDAISGNRSRSRLATAPGRRRASRAKLSISRFASGTKSSEPKPVPANAMPIARPRRAGVVQPATTDATGPKPVMPKSDACR